MQMLPMTSRPIVVPIRPWNSSQHVNVGPRRVALAIAALIVIGSTVLWAIVDPVMEAIYFERAPRFLNDLIRNREVHDLARYQQDARLIVGSVVRDALIVASLLVAHAFLHIDLLEVTRRAGHPATSAKDLLRATWHELAEGRRARAAMIAGAGVILLGVIGRARPLLSVALTGGVLVGLLLIPQRTLQADRSLPVEPKARTIVAVISLAVVASAIILFRIGDFDFREDEFQVISAAYTHSQVGTYQGWDWAQDVPSEGAPYTRASQHTWLIARFIAVFGMSEGITRLPGAIAGILLTALAYPTMLSATRSRAAALLTSAFVLLTFAATFRYARMYALVVPLSLLWTYVHAMALKRLEQSFRTGVMLLATSGAIGLLAYELHINTLSLAAAFALPTAMTLHRALLGHGWRRASLWSMWMALTIPAIGAALLVAERVRWALSPFARRNYQYVDILFANPFPTALSGAIGAVLVGVTVGTLLRRREDGARHHPFFLLSIASLAFAVPFFVFVADRYVSGTYVAHVRVLVLALIATGLAIVIGSLARSRVRSMAVLSVLIVAVSAWLPGLDRIYGDGHRYGVHSAAYRIIASDLDPSTDIILGQYFRTYYAQGPLFRDTERIGMGRNRSFSLTELEHALDRQDRAWVTWEARKSYHLASDVRQAIAERGRQVSGPGVDGTRVYVYLIDG